ncbi:Aminopeptidase 2 mitochondrial [Marasmius tenuissimus]|nr:Aminopeptidase 2 mitochondrial [Marasmius tenuissimus]
MLAAHIGADRFLKGVSIYLKNHLYGNSTTRDLWDAISESTGRDIVILMNDWINKIGFPVLTVTETELGIKIRQDRLLETGIAETKDNQTIWNVPLFTLTIGTNGMPVVDNSAVLDAREKIYSIDTSKPFKLNAGTNGVYRVLYSTDRYKRIANELSMPNSPFTLGDRLGLISDSLALSKAALIDLSDALTLVDALRGETEYLAWSGISAGLQEIASVWAEHLEILNPLNTFRRSLFNPLVKKLGFDYSESESVDTKQLRTCAIENAASAGETSVIEELKSRFQSYMDTGNDSGIPPELHKATYSAAIKHGGTVEFNFTKKIYETSKSPTSKSAAIAALALVRNETLLAEVMEFARTGTRDQDVFLFFRGWRQNFEARLPAIAFFKEHYDEFYRRFADSYTFQSLVESSVAVLTTEKDLQETITFFEGKETSKCSLALAQSFDTVRGRIAYIKRSTDNLRDWLEGFGSR